MRMPDGTVPVLLSSSDPDGVRAEAAALRTYMGNHPEVTVQQVGDILAATRTPRPHRALIRVPREGRDELVDALRVLEAGGVPDSVTMGHATPRRIAMVFPGQGGQYPGMGSLFYRMSDAYRDIVEECDALARREYDTLPSTYLLDPSAPEKHDLIQPAMFVHMMGVQRMWEHAGIRPDMTVGHSQGEIAASVVAGAVSLEDGLRAVIVRSCEIERVAARDNLAGCHAMAVVGTDRDTVERLLPDLDGWADVTVVNSPTLHAVSGDVRALDNLEVVLKERGIFVRRIAVDFAAHTHVVDRARSAMVERLRDARLEPMADGRVPFISSVVGGRISAGREQPPYWIANLRQRVRFDLAVRAALDEGATSFIEMSSHPTLLVAVKENIAAVGAEDIRLCGTARRESEGLEHFAENLAGVVTTHRGAVLPRPAGSVCVPLDFPSTVWRRASFWSPTGTVSSTSGVRGAQPHIVVDRWEPVGVWDLPEPRRLLLMTEGPALSQGSVAAEAERYGSAVVAEPGDGAVGIIEVVSSPLSSVAELVATMHEFLSTADLTGLDDLVLVTTGAEDRPGLPAATAPAAVAAMARCMASELAPVRVRHLDVDPAEAHNAARWVVEAVHTPGEPDMAVVSGELRVRRLVRELPAGREGEAAGGVADYGAAVVVGGTGAVGREVCRRLAERGIPWIVCVSRRGAQGAGSLVAADLDAVRNATGAQVDDLRCDVTDHDAVRDLGRTVRAGVGDGRVLVVQCAVDYAAAADLDWEASLAAKSGTLSPLTSELLREGDRLIVFSSMSASIGARGHCAYAAANRAVETEAVARLGGCAGAQVTAVRWGLWPGVGASAGVGGGSVSDITAAGFQPMDPASAVDAALAVDPVSGPNVVSIAAVDWARTAAVFEAVGMSPLFDQVVAGDGGVGVLSSPVGEDSAPVCAEPSHQDEHCEEVVVETSRVVPGVDDPAGVVDRVVRTKLGYAAGEPLDTAMPLVSLGIDSLQALDVQTELADVAGGVVTAASILGGATVDDLCDMVRRETV
ncbi:SDR family NAD(P)-dependent oxidoreductase [Corynebacterium kroppenstedtii]|uniref:SDR family NAD(P)-dependent oxidoreductase n=1 Tax=Corynebacterium sp. PCR 32 TaxID=3351342 RepID=UPI0030B1BF23